MPLSEREPKRDLFESELNRAARVREDLFFIESLENGDFVRNFPNYGVGDLCLRVNEALASMDEYFEDAHMKILGERISFIREYFSIFLLFVDFMRDRRFFSSEDFAFLLSRLPDVCNKGFFNISGKVLLDEFFEYMSKLVSDYVPEKSFIGDRLIFFNELHSCVEELVSQRACFSAEQINQLVGFSQELDEIFAVYKGLLGENEKKALVVVGDYLKVVLQSSTRVYTGIDRQQIEKFRLKLRMREDFSGENEKSDLRFDVEDICFCDVAFSEELRMEINARDKEDYELVSKMFGKDDFQKVFREAREFIGSLLRCERSFSAATQRDFLVFCERCGLPSFTDMESFLKHVKAKCLYAYLAGNIFDRLQAGEDFSMDEIRRNCRRESFFVFLSCKVVFLLKECIYFFHSGEFADVEDFERKIAQMNEFLDANLIKDFNGDDVDKERELFVRLKYMTIRKKFFELVKFFVGSNDKFQKAALAIGTLRAQARDFLVVLDDFMKSADKNARFEPEFWDKIAEIKAFCLKLAK